MIVTNLTGWRYPDNPSTGKGGGQFTTDSWARVRLDQPYTTGGWVIPIPLVEKPWAVVQVDPSPGLIPAGETSDGEPLGPFMLTWDGNTTEPRLIAFGDAVELPNGYTLSPAPTITLHMVQQTGIVS